MTGPELQARFDEEAATIERGRSACAPVRPAGELGMIEGAALVLGIFTLLPFIAALLP